MKTGKQKTTPLKISVVIPVYNTGKFLPACLDSVLSQSMPDFEVLAVNDASTDDSLGILADYAAKAPRIRIINHECNKGLLAARISGIKAASGKYLLFLDSDDCFLPGFLKKLWSVAEKKQADIVHFPLVIRDRNQSLSTRLLRLAEKKSRPFAQELHGDDVFRKYFVENAYGWSAVQKLYRTEICRKAAEFIPDQFCLMAEDFCFYTVCAFFAKHYVPMHQGGYVYFMDSGISSGQKTSLEKFLGRQSPFQALRNIKDFLLRQKVFDKYRDAFETQEQKPLGEYVLRWMRYLPDDDRAAAFNTIFRQYDQDVLFFALRRFFNGLDEHFLELLTGEDPEPVPFPEQLRRPCLTPVLHHHDISLDRWHEWKQLIDADHYDAVILPPDDNADRLFWDIRAIRDAGAAAVCRRDMSYLAVLDSHGVKDLFQ